MIDTVGGSGVKGRALMRRAGDWPWGLLGMAALIVAVEAPVARQALEYLDGTGVTWALSGRSARREALRGGVLCFGDSLLKFGLDPGGVERATGKRAYNLAVNAGHAPASYFLLRKALAAGARPAAVLVDFEPNILAQTPVVAPELWAELAGPRDLVELGLASRDGRFLGRALLGWLLPTHRYREQLRGAVVGALLGRPPARPDGGGPPPLREARRDRGGLAVPHRVWPAVAVDPGNHAFFPGDWHCDPLNRHYAKKFFALAAANHVPVFWVLTPYARPIQAQRERYGQDGRFTRFAAALRSRFPGVTVVDGRRPGFDASLYWDGTVHLDDRGAEALTADVAAVLKRSFDGERLPAWVTLPGDRGGRPRAEVAVRPGPAASAPH